MSSEIQAIVQQYPQMLDIVRAMVKREKEGASYVGFRAAASQRKFIEEAAAADRRSLSDFMRLGAIERAERLLGRAFQEKTDAPETKKKGKVGKV